VFPDSPAYPVRLPKKIPCVPRPLAKGNLQGYTLIELIVVIALIGLLLAVGMPRLRTSLLTNNLKLTTRRIIGIAKGLRNKAVREQKVYYLYLDLDNNRYWTDSGAQSDEERSLARQGAVNFAEDVRIVDVWSRSKGKQADGEAVIRFSAKGYVDLTAIHLGAADDRQVTLVLAPFLGTIKIYDKYVDFVGRAS